MTAAEPLLHVQNVNVGFHTARGYAPVITDVGFALHKGQTLAIVGESGSGKSALAKTILQILPGNARIGPDSRILWHGKNLVGQKEAALRRLRGKSIGMVFQDPMSSLNPFRTVGSQLAEGMRLHLGIGHDEAMRRAIRLLDDVGLSSPAARISQYPHELSGGMRQRVIIAMAIACEPELLIADEPTTALDVTVQADVLQLLARLQRERGMALILITHDMGVAAHHSENLAVMYSGQLVEQGQTRDVLQNPVMPYTAALIASIPRMQDESHKTLHTIAGRPPTPHEFLPGCRFMPRCRQPSPQCQQPPPLRQSTSQQRDYRCWHPLEPAHV
jgi:peptide/nickel transport system ATP-binding protein